MAVGADQLAAGLALDLSNVEGLLGHLAQALVQAVPQHVRVESGGGRVRGIELMLEPDGFVLRRDGQHVVCQYKKLVRGVALKTKDLPLAQWVETLAQALARHANVSAQAGALAAQLARSSSILPNR
jgi:hypothetical protein